jgi:hypothetical protein
MIAFKSVDVLPCLRADDYQAMSRRAKRASMAGTFREEDYA